MDINTAITLLTIVVILISVVIVTVLIVAIILILKINLLIKNVNRIAGNIAEASTWLSPLKIIGTITGMMHKHKRNN